ncbi:MAG: DUF971 domain-containing protein, partial [Gammaproteobacteria bacterium]|nr:DUF971 domain-containing protein [Gammaproteobacteria bacterium]
MSSPRVSAVTVAPETLTVHWSDGSRDEFSSLWLRDNVPEDRDPHSGQRLIDITDLPEAPRLTAAHPAADALRIEWQDQDRPAQFSL